MPIEFTEIHASSSAKELNSEWFVLRNTGEKSFTTRGCDLYVSKKGKGKSRSVGTIEPGFSLSPGAEVRVVTGNPGKKAHGKVPADEGRSTYHLFLAAPILAGSGTTLSLRLRSMEIAKAEYDAKSESGLASKA